MNSDNTTEINNLIVHLPEEDKGKISDGYHTFQELYDHRCMLFVALLNSLYYDKDSADYNCFKARKHHDGTELDGWIIAGINPIGMGEDKQITYHLPEKMWDDLHVCPAECAPKFDGHTPADVLARLRELFT